MFVWTIAALCLYGFKLVHAHILSVMSQTTCVPHKPLQVFSKSQNCYESFDEPVEHVVDLKTTINRLFKLQTYQCFEPVEMDAAMYLERYGGRGTCSIASPQCRSKTYGRLPIVKRHMKAPKIERQHHKIIRMPSVR